MQNCVYFMVILQSLNAVDSRVYCQDSHASSWVPFGYSCPVLCQNIVNAIERLKIMDFENLIYRQPYEVPAKTLSLKNEIISDEEQEKKKFNLFKNRKHFKNIKKIEYKRTINKNHSRDENNFYKDVIKLTQLAAKTFKGDCIRSKRGRLVAMLKCARKSNIDGSFLKIMTKLLNKYANSVYKFTEDMTEVLLEKILGENTDVRNNIFDVNKLLGYLRQELHVHKEHENSDVIALSSKQCLTLSLPGCFCKTGFVENSGQCVRPSDCVQNYIHDEYVARVVVD